MSDEIKKPVRTNPFVEESRARKLLSNGEKVLEWLSQQPGWESGAANHVIADAIGVPLDPGRPQSRRLGEAMEALRSAGMIEMEFVTPHPRKNPTGRMLRLTAAGARFLQTERKGDEG